MYSCASRKYQITCYKREINTNVFAFIVCLWDYHLKALSAEIFIGRLFFLVYGQFSLF